MWEGRVWRYGVKQLVRNIIVSVGALASLIALVLTMHTPDAPWTGWQLGFLGLSGTFGIASITLDVIEYRARTVKVFKGPERIGRYMYQWIDRAGAVAIFTRDLSWVSAPGVKDLLIRKAMNDQLTIVLPREISISRDLEKLGAQTLYYPNIDYVIRSRFTIVNIDRVDTRVAIGRTDGDLHKVEEFSAGEQPAFYLAQDLLELAKRFNATQRDAVL
jgi:hypothetical protein